MGKLIVLEGLDGSGKTTQTPLLAQALQAAGKNVRIISFPDYGSDSSALVRLYLSGAFGTHPDDVNAYAASSFFAVDRYLSYVRDWRAFYERPDAVVLATRYTSANEIHQLAKLPPERWDGFLRWAEEYEFEKLGIPRPDAVLFLDMKYEIAMSLVSGRSDSTGQKKDIHELDADYMKRCRAAARYAAEALGWRTVVCYAGDVPLTPETIAAKILEEVEKIPGFSGQTKGDTQ